MSLLRWRDCSKRGSQEGWPKWVEVGIAAGTVALKALAAVPSRFIRLSDCRHVLLLEKAKCPDSIAPMNDDYPTSDQLRSESPKRSHFLELKAITNEKDTIVFS